MKKVLRMNKYNLINNKQYYWSEFNKFKYWSNLKDKESIKNRLEYNSIIGKLIQYKMKLCNIKTKLIKVIKNE